MSRRVRNLFFAAFDWASDHPMLDVILAVVVGSLAWALPDPTSKLPPSDLSGLYASAAAVAAVVGGLGSLAVAAYSSGQGARIKQLRRHQGRSLRRNFAAMLAATFASAAVAWSAQLVAFHSVSIAWSLCVGALTLAGVTVVRQTLLFGGLMNLSDKDQASARPLSRHTPQMDAARDAAQRRSA